MSLLEGFEGSSFDGSGSAAATAGKAKPACHGSVCHRGGCLARPGRVVSFVCSCSIQARTVVTDIILGTWARSMPGVGGARR